MFFLLCKSMFLNNPVITPKIKNANRRKTGIRRKVEIGQKIPKFWTETPLIWIQFLPLRRIASAIWISGLRGENGKDSLEPASEVTRSAYLRKKVGGGGWRARAPASGAATAGRRVLQRKQSTADSNRKAASAWREFLHERSEKAKSMTSAQVSCAQRASLNTSGGGCKEERRSRPSSRDWGGRQATAQWQHKKQGCDEGALAKPLLYADLWCAQTTTKTAFPVCGTSAPEPQGGGTRVGERAIWSRKAEKRERGIERLR